MKILPLNNNRLFFSSTKQQYSYDKKSNFQINCTPNTDTFENSNKPNKENAAENKITDFNAILSMPRAINVKPISKNSYRGSTLEKNKAALKILKDSGVERIVDLVGYDLYRKNAEEAGLEYYSYSIDYNFFTKAVFMNEAEYKRTTGLDSKTYEANKRDFINNFVKFIQIMQKDYLYIGCSYGTYNTDTAILLNSVFNPKAENIGFCDDSLTIEALMELYKNLTDEDKRKMGYTEEFDKSIMPKLERMEKAAYI